MDTDELRALIEAESRAAEEGDLPPDAPLPAHCTVTRGH